MSYDVHGGIRFNVVSYTVELVVRVNIGDVETLLLILVDGKFSCRQ